MAEKKDRRMEQFKVELTEGAKVKRVIGVVSGKGGVGKSLVTSLLATASAKAGLRTAVLDGDILGPSIPTLFGVNMRAETDGHALVPVMSETGIQLMSINLVLDDPAQPVIFRGQMLANTLKQFWSQVYWDDVDIMYIDMPPGTGDVPLTAFQSFPVDGIVLVTSPQDLVNQVVEKAVNMAEVMRIPIMGIVENMSYFKCPDCGKEHRIFGESHLPEVVGRHKILKDVPVIELPMDLEIPKLTDQGNIEKADTSALEELVKAFAEIPPTE